MDCTCHRRIAVHQTRRPKPSRSQLDPGGVAPIQVRFLRQIDRRFTKLARMIREVVDRRDVFGLEPAKPRTMIQSATLPGERAFEFMTNPEKHARFMAWLQAAEREEILELYLGPEEIVKDRRWTDLYVREGYNRGAETSYYAALDAASSEGWDIAVVEMLGQPMHVRRVAEVYTRTYTALENITEAMDTAISETLAEGLARGLNPKEIAVDLMGRVESIGKVRANTLARTEVMNAHAEGALGTYESLGVDAVGVLVEWTTAGYDVCPICEELGGQRYTLADAHGVLPAHPNCRCVWVPFVGVEDDDV